MTLALTEAQGRCLLQVMAYGTIGEDFFSQIPLAEHLGVKTKMLSSEKVILEAPLEPNRNPKNTAFGGSLYSVAVLSAWMLVSQAAVSEGIECEYIVIQSGEMEYVEPVTESFESEAQWTSVESREKFIMTLRRRGLARARLDALIRCSGKIRCRLQARFAAQKKRS